MHALRPASGTKRRRLRLGRDERGNFVIELGAALPVLLVLLLGGIELTRFVLVNQKVERTSASLADLVAQSAVVTEAGMNNLFQAAKFVMDPFDVSKQGRLVVTSIAASGGPARIRWQRSYGDAEGSSAFGTEGSVATLPEGLVVRDGENVILCEAFFRYEPMVFQDIIDETTVRRFAVFRPRYGSLDVIYP
ncbi:MAG: TadE/TadG family type IV pilus assembly protein [Allosphingosinicella sp.]